MDINYRVAEISSKAYLPEEICIKKLQSGAAAVNNELAKELIENCRKKPLGISQNLISKYSVKSAEGRAVMSLAESLLRVPDKATAALLTKDKAPEFLGVFGKLPLMQEPAKMAVKLLGAEFVIGETLQKAQKYAEKFKKRGYKISYDMLGEGARTKAQAAKYFASYKNAIEQAEDGDSISVKISALHPKFELLKLEILEVELLPKLAELLKLASSRKITVVIDAEEARRLDITLIVFAKLYAQGLRGFGLAVQAYQKRAVYVLEFLLELAREYNIKIPVRLVKGAYWDSEIKAAQVAGTEDYPVFTIKKNTDISYLYCAKFLAKNTKYFYPQFATHNAGSIAAIIGLNLKTDEFEFQKLYGMGDDLHEQLLARGYQSRIYAPVGNFSELLAYLIRRLLENGANSSFVNQLADKKISVEEVLRGEENAKIILKPAQIFGERKNSVGFDLGNLHQVNLIKSELAKAKLPKFVEQKWSVEGAIKSQKVWDKKGADARAKILEKIADEFEGQKFILIKCLMQEAKKTLADSIGEVREAVDFCRYYAEQARQIFAPKNMAGATGERNEYQLEGRGVFVCISPWNFPLAIFSGQIAAALVAGNSVIAKPAEQTTQIAKIAAQIMQKCGAPMQLAVGAGSKVGAALVSNPKIVGVCFTGSTEVARIINKTLAETNPNIVPLLAETGGQNCMIVDSTALPEQAVDDIITSAFNSAGQRCSALRVCYIQEEIYAKLTEILKGAVDELNIGEAEDFATDISEVIDAKAKDNLQKHISKMQIKVLHSAKAQGGNFVAPTIIEIENIAELESEVFGPVLHLRKFKAADLDKIYAEINSSGYGLTFGIHTRIEGRAREAASRIHSGNIYVNRNMIGAIVESQPFGGMGLSGTGPKAGGPRYLLKFCHEKVISTNTTAWGGNLDLL